MANPKKKIEVEAVEQVVVTEPVEAIEIEEVEAEAPVVTAAPAETDVIEGQLGIYENRVISVPADVKSVEVENIEGGDMFVDNTCIQYSSNYILAPGQVKVYKGAKNIFLSSASRPIFRVRFFKG